MADADDPVTRYAQEVTSGNILAGRLVHLACARHLDDLENGPARGLRWDPDAAAHVLRFFRWLRLAEGEHAGKPFTLQPWQQFVAGCLFGWKSDEEGTGHRRFRTAYIEIAKGNGKSPLAAGIGLYGLLADGEQGAEIYSAATTREQASILFRDAKNMVSASPELSKRLEVGQVNIAHLQSRSFFRPVSSEHRGLDGKRVHIALVDELHEHPTALVVDKIRAGVKGRRQPMVFEITNSGHDRASVCWQHHQYSADVLQGRVQNDSWFAFICSLDPCQLHQEEGKLQPVEGCPDCDDWRDERVWPKANPNLGVSVHLRYLREQVAEAQGMNTKEGLVRRLNFCWWTESETAWLTPAVWSRGAGPISRADLIGRECYGGLDLASKVDVASLVLAFPDYPSTDQISLLCRFWIPREAAQTRAHADGVPWLVWDRQGLVTLTDGDVIDLAQIEEDIKTDAGDFAIEEIAFDPWNAAHISQSLQEFGIKMVEFSQNIRNFNEPTKHFEALLKVGQLRHGSHACLDWMAGNVAVITDRSGNVRPVKPKHDSPKKVDGIIAAVMAVARVMLRTPGGSAGGITWL